MNEPPEVLEHCKGGRYYDVNGNPIEVYFKRRGYDFPVYVFGEKALSGNDINALWKEEGYFSCQFSAVLIQEIWCLEITRETYLAETNAEFLQKIIKFFKKHFDTDLEETVLK
jgi:hypothetical protein